MAFDDDGLVDLLTNVLTAEQRQRILPTNPHGALQINLARAGRWACLAEVAELTARACGLELDRTADDYLQNYIQKIIDRLTVNV